MKTLTVDRYDYMRKMEMKTEPPANVALPPMKGPVMPEFPEPTGGRPPAPLAPGAANNSRK
jgi:hypothetical protein